MLDRIFIFYNAYIGGKMIKLKEIYRLYRVEIILTAIIVLFSYGLVLFPHYSQDTYAKVYIYAGMSTTEYIKSLEDIAGFGRYVYVALLILTKIITGSGLFYGNILNVINIILFFVLIILTFLFLNDTNSSKYMKILNYFISVSIYITPLLFDWILFVECTPYYLFGILLVILCLMFFWRDNRKNKYYVYSIFLIVMAVGIYQPVLSYFILLFMMKLWKNSINKLWKDSTINVLKYINSNVIQGAFLCVVSVVTQVIVIKIYNNNSRIESELINNIKYVINAQKSLWLMENVGGTTYIYIILFSILCILFIYSLLKINTDRRIKISIFLISVLFFTMWYLSIFSTHIFIEAWLSQRTIPTFYSGLSILIYFTVEVYLKCENQEKKKCFYSIVTILLIFFITNNVYKLNILQIDLIKTNTLDKHLAILIEKEIEKYENSSGVKITKIAIREDKYTTWAYPDIFCNYDMNVRGLAKDWTTAGTIYFYTGRYLEQVQMKEDIYNKHFAMKDWDSFSIEQLYLDGDTLNICLY